MSNSGKSKKKGSSRPAGRPKSVTPGPATSGVSVFVRLEQNIVDELDEMVALARAHPTLKHMSISRSTLIRASVETGLKVWCKTQGLERPGLNGAAVSAEPAE